MVRTAIILILTFLNTKGNCQDTIPTFKRQYNYFSLFTSQDFVAGSINYGIEKRRVGYELGIHYPLLASSLIQRSVFGNVGLNFGVYYHNRPLDDKLQIAIVSRFRVIQVKTESIIELIDPDQPSVPPFYKFRRYWMEGYGGAMITHYFLPRIYVRFEIYLGYMLEYKKNLDGLVNQYPSWTSVRLQHAQAGFRYELFR